MNAKNYTFFRGKTVSVVLEDGVTAIFTVRQFRLREYKALLPKTGDEIELVAAACGKTRAEIEAVQPASYEALYAALKEVNADGFFTFAARRMADGQREIQNMLDAGLPADKVMDMLAAAGRAISSTPSRPLPPPAA